MLTCYFKNGKKTSLRHAVIDVMIIEQNRILLVKRAPHISNGNKWALPGGYVDRGEFINDTAIREAREETGYDIDLGPLFRVNDNPNRRNEDRQNISFIYLAKFVKKVGTMDKESTEIRWFDLDKLPEEEDFAFDHRDNIRLYLQHQKKPFLLPIIGKIDTYGI